MTFPAPWTVHHNEDAWWVEDRDGKRFGFVYVRDPPIAGTGQESYHTHDEARRLVSNFAKLPALLQRSEARSGGGHSA